MMIAIFAVVRGIRFEGFSVKLLVLSLSVGLLFIYILNDFCTISSRITGTGIYMG
jgi:hypothetical protein